MKPIKIYYYLGRERNTQHEILTQDHFLANQRSNGTPDLSTTIGSYI